MIWKLLFSIFIILRPLLYDDRNKVVIGLPKGMNCVCSCYSIDIDFEIIYKYYHI